VWGADDDEPLHCVQVQQITHDVRTFTFETDQPRLAKHEPGQYMVLGVDTGAATAERCYTISSPPTRPARLAVTVKREPGGLVSNWLHDHLRPGMTVRARGPLGSFTTANYPAQRYLLLSGGSGATPMMSTLRTFFDLASPVDVAYVHSARTPADILFRRELDSMTLGTIGRPSMTVTHFCENHSEDELWSGPMGRVDAESLAQVVPDIRTREVFACGPPAYLDAVRQIMSVLDVPTERYHEETFAFAPVGVATPPEASALSGSGFNVEFARSGRTAQWEPGTTLLATAAKAGVLVPTSCGQGLCGTCKVTKLAGDVDVSHQGGIRPKEIAAGKLLACCSVPTSDVVLDI
jgi:ferredoxin-NADP reductase